MSAVKTGNRAILRQYVGYGSISFRKVTSATTIPTPFRRGYINLGGLTRTGEVSAAEHAARVERIIAVYEQMIARAHAHGLRIYGVTITPYMGSDYYHPGPTNELDRQAVNAWIRASGHFDSVIDLDAVVRDPEHPDRLLPAYDCGDHLHPSPKGYKAVGQAIPFSLFAQ